jgi:hypothetical protein
MLKIFRRFPDAREFLLAEEGLEPMVLELPDRYGDPKRREKVKRFAQTADDKAIIALLTNVDEFQSGVDARRRLEELEKK